MEQSIRNALLEVEGELLRATEKFGPFASAHEGKAIIEEELDELWGEIKANNGESEAAYNEAKQVAAMAVRYMVDIGRGKDGNTTS